MAVAWVGGGGVVAVFDVVVTLCVQLHSYTCVQARTIETYTLVAL